MSTARALPTRLAASLVAALAATALAVAGAAPAASSERGSSPAELRAVRAAVHPGFDRVVFEFAGPLPRVNARYVDTLRKPADPDAPVPAPGRAAIEVAFDGVDTHDGRAVPHGPDSRAHALTNVTSVLRVGLAEPRAVYGLALLSAEPYRLFTLTNPSRVVVDVDHPDRTVFRRVYLVDTTRVVDNRTPYVTPVVRSVLPWTPAAGVLDRLFAGPTTAEVSRGLKTPEPPSPTARSGATGWADLSIRDGVARVRLTGGCSSGGSTVTVADEIVPTLKQFASVDFVKIYDPAGRTADPTGRSDSIPECLEP
jgi:hypothetical protein